MGLVYRKYGFSGLESTVSVSAFDHCGLGENIRKLSSFLLNNKTENDSVSSASRTPNDSEAPKAPETQDALLMLC